MEQLVKYKAGFEFSKNQMVSLAKMIEVHSYADSLGEKALQEWGSEVQG